MSKVVIVVGIRPETVKMAPVIRLLQRNGFNPTLIHTSQHYKSAF